jgi:hypothetical protein
MAKNRFIYAAVSATDANAIPVDNILGMEAGSADAESLVIYHQGFDDQDNNGQIDLEITHAEQLLRLSTSLLIRLLFLVTM